MMSRSSLQFARILPVLLSLFSMFLGRGTSFTPHTAIYRHSSTGQQFQQSKRKECPFIATSPRHSLLVSSRNNCKSRSRRQLLLHHNLLSSALPSSSAVGATVALVSSSLVGLQLDRWIPSGAGILGSMLMASLLSNLFPTFIPSKHPIYDLCWTLFLPASLTLMLLATNDSDDKNNKSSEDTNSTTTTSVTATKQQQQQQLNKGRFSSSSASIASCIRRVSGPFAIACIASLIGCWTSFQVAVKSNWFPSIEQARLAAACISASYIGGSVNCFATARIVGASSEFLSSLATADLICMATYFSGLSASLDWNWLRSKFHHNKKESSVSSLPISPLSRKAAISSNKTNKNNFSQTKNKRPSIIEDVIAERMAGIAVSFKRDSTASKLLSKAKVIIPLLGMTLCIVQLANRIEAFASRWIPGTACAIIALVTPCLQRSLATKQQSWWRPLGNMAAPLANVCFLTFFASIGVGTSNLRQSFLSTGPACLSFALLSLLIHSCLTILGSLLLFSRGGRRGGAEMEDVWIASNAAIGGPATAAAFCQRMKSDNPAKLQGRTIAATVWGVVGYAIGTMLGVGMYKVVGGGNTMP